MHRRNLSQQSEGTQTVNKGHVGVRYVVDVEAVSATGGLRYRAVANSRQVGRVGTVATLAFVGKRMIAMYKLLSEEQCWLAVGSFVIILEKDGVINFFNGT